jgi:hypothetical protein
MEYIILTRGQKRLFNAMKRNECRAIAYGPRTWYTEVEYGKRIYFNDKTMMVLEDKGIVIRGEHSANIVPGMENIDIKVTNRDYSRRSRKSGPIEEEE